jgi:ATP-binding cassette subfamily F protein 3
VLKEALVHYEGTFIIVSHDREFVDGLSNRIWDIENQGVKIHHFSLQEYLNYKTQKSPNAIEEAPVKESKKDKPTEESSKPRIDKAQQKAQREIQQIEQQIDQQEKALSEIEIELGNIDYEDKNNYNAVLNRYEQAKAQVDQLYKKWEEKSAAL